MALKRAVITGMETILPIGKNLKESIANISAGRDLSHYTTTEFGDKPVGLIKDEFFNEDMDDRERVKYDRVSMLVSSVLKQCIESAGLSGDKSELNETGIISGSGFGCQKAQDVLIRALIEGGPLMVDPLKFPHTSHNYPISISSIKYGLMGPISSIVASISSGLNALIFANYLISKGQAKRIIVIAYDEITDFIYANLNENNLLAEKDNFKPFDKNSSGTCPFEGCTAFVIEEPDTALQRGAKIFGEIAGWHASYGSYKKTLDEKLSSNIKKTIQKAGLDKNEVDLFILNSSGIPADDIPEELSLKKFNDEGYLLCPHFTFKPIMGNYLGAAGLTELAISLKMINDENTEYLMKNRKSFPFTNLQFDPKDKFNSILINNFGMGGNIISLAITLKSKA